MWIRSLYVLLGADISCMVMSINNNNFEGAVIHVLAMLCVVTAIVLEESRK